MNQVSTGPITGSLKPKYKVISTHLGELYDVQKGLDVFIDFNTFIHSLSGYNKYLNYLPFSGPDVEVDLISSILTTLNHWKNFTKKWDNVRIIGIMNAFEMGKLCETQQLRSYLIPYMNRFKADKLQQLVYYVTEAVKKVQAILKYVPNMYLITCTEFDSMVIPNVLDDYTKSGRKRIIISGNPLMTSYQSEPNTNVLYSKFGKNGMSQLSDPVMIVKSITKVEDDIVEEFTKNKVFFNLLLDIVGDFERGITGLTQMGITTFAYNLLRGIEQGTITQNPKSFESCLPVIDKVYHQYVKQTYPLVDIQSHTNLITKSAIERVKADMIDLVDIDGLRSLSIDGLNLLELL